MVSATQREPAFKAPTDANATDPAPPPEGADEWAPPPELGLSIATARKLAPSGLGEPAPHKFALITIFGNDVPTLL